MNYYTTEKQRQALRKQVKNGEWIALQDTVFTFKNDKERSRFIDEHEDEFHAKLKPVGYHGCGLAILNLETLTLAAHEQVENLKNKEYLLDDSKKYMLVYCSCWEIARSGAYIGGDDYE